ncbi:MAG TPA: formylmethanofuran dehydrogenase subunit C [Isosphaeraceae bacterium]|jgi:formylmethanofuran dehydrogenase subunit C
MPLHLLWNDATTLPVEAEGLRPDALADRTPGEVARLRLPVGNGTAELGELFRIEGDGAADGRLVLEGDLRRVRRLGAGLASGTLLVRGDAGPHLGAGMTGGTIEVVGSAGAWAGAEMRGGLLRLRGRAGDHLGAALPGSRLGMRDGVILVDGPIGADAGRSMRRGLIAATGPCGAGLGRAMVAGSVFAFGPIGPRAGAGMKRGTLALFDVAPPELLPSFAPSGRYRPPFVTLYLRRLRAWDFPVPDAACAGAFDRFNGDRVEGGQGEVLVWKPG